MNRWTTSDASFVELVGVESAGATAAATMIVGNRTLAEEIVQDVFERAYRRWTKVSRLDRPGAWIRRAVINQSISVVRRANTERRALARIRNVPSGNRADGLDGHDAMNRLIGDEIWRVVGQLPVDQATAVALHYGADLAVQTVAEEMDLSATAVKSLLYRARQQLRQHTMLKEMAHDIR